MANISIYIIEDEELFANQLEILVEKLDYELAGRSDNSDTAKVEIEKLSPDLLLADININGTMDGIELVDSLETKLPTIFITSLSDDETFARAREVGPHAFLTKPFDDKALQRAIELAISDKGTSGDNSAEWSEDRSFGHSFFIKNRSKLEKVNVDEIVYLEVEDRYSTIFTEDGRKFVLRMSIGAVQEKLPDDSFLRVHRKYAVNLQKIKSIDTQDNLIHVGETSIPLSRSHKEELMRRVDWLQ